MLEQDWQSWFSSQVLKRGQQYYEENRVSRMMRINDGWQATVEGTECYEVFLGDELDCSYCTCPYFIDYGFCKHIAAVCFECDNLKLSDSKTESASYASGSSNAEAIIRELSAQSQLDLLLEIVQTDSHWHDMVIRRFGHINDEQVEADFIAGISDITRSYSSYGFIDYQNAFHFKRELNRYVIDYIDPFIKRGAYGLALQLTFAFELSLPKISIDDSDGFFETVVDLINVYWEELLATEDPDIKPALFSWLSELVHTDDSTDDEADILWLLQNNAREVIKSYFATDAQFAAETELLALDMLENENVSDEQFSFYFVPTGISWVIIKLHCMQTLGRSFQEMCDFADGQIPSYDISRILVDMACEHGDNDKAIQLLESLIDRSHDQHYPTEAALRLLDILKEQGLEEKVNKLCIDLIINGLTNDDNQLGSWIREARKSAGDNWPDQEDELIVQLGQKHHRLQVLYAETGHLDDLMEIIRSDGSIYEFYRYEDILADKFSNEYLSFYEKAVRETLFGEAAKRKVYRHRVELLLRMRKIPGGTDVVNRIVGELRSTYPNRRALMEELDRLG